MGTTFAPKSLKGGGFALGSFPFGRRLHFCGETPTFVVKVGGGNISAFWGETKEMGVCF